MDDDQDNLSENFSTPLESPTNSLLVSPVTPGAARGSNTCLSCCHRRPTSSESDQGSDGPPVLKNFPSEDECDDDS